ncbi:hypothetical protein FBEOM_3938 [Fusarium beomiforme]|uniref:Uncharacterized protein n=1 Tax=Fusarium beomiforme TaxID=44412 RepID=A0A9P5AP43_9HYPO|nr:hypothetical protein FBEOM_3938 [Fusarium beomiforme]
MASTNDKEELSVLHGVVRYRLARDSNGQTTIGAKWVSTRIANAGQTGTGHTVRQITSPSNDMSEAGFEGDWAIEYFGPDGQLAVTPFLLKLTKNGEVSKREWFDRRQRMSLECHFGYSMQSVIDYASRFIMANGVSRMVIQSWKALVSRKQDS